MARGLWWAVRALDGGPVWALASGAAVASSALVRGSGLVLAPVLVLWLLLWLPGKWRRRLIGAGLAALALVAVLAGYVGVVRVSGGRYSGLTDMNGWDLYGRVAPFADCTKFMPPEGTEVLCESTPPSLRPGPF